MAGNDEQNLHFKLPAGLGIFSRFKDLPYDIRHKIWEHLMYTPGIHFLKFERNRVSRFSSDDDHENSSTDGGLSGSTVNTSSSQGSRRSGSGVVVNKPIKRYSATLKPVLPLPSADLSYHVTKSKTLAQLSDSCNEAAFEVSRATSQPDNLTLDNGRLITLAKSFDIVCIDYPDLPYTRRLGQWASDLDTAQLAKIHHIAVRYHPSWDEERYLCRVCGLYHEVLPGSRKNQAPRKHLYEFAALFPNLETFYLIDHLIVRRPLLSEDEHADPRWLGPSDRARFMAELPVSKGRPETFESRGLTYLEVDRRLCKVCKVHSHVFNMLEWVQENYVAFCERKARHKHKDLNSVRFAVLACEWAQKKLVAGKEQRAVGLKKRRRKELTRRMVVQEDHVLIEAMNALKLESTYRDYPVPPSLPVVFGDEGRSAFAFTLTVEQ